MLNSTTVVICFLGSSVVLHGTESNSQVYQFLVFFESSFSFHKLKDVTLLL